MNAQWVKRVLHTAYFQPNAVRTIAWGPLRGMVFRVNSITGMSPFYSGTERAHQRVFQRFVTPGAVVLDIGANWGIHTLYLSRLVGAKGRVIAFEPYPPAFQELVWHVQANHCANVLPLNVALGDVNDTLPFEIGANASQGKLSERDASLTEKQILKVTARTLDSMSDELALAQFALAKIDVEGAESRVLIGAQTLIRRIKPILVIDLHNPIQDLAVSKWSLQEKYSLSHLDGTPILKTDASWPDPDGVWGSILAQSKDTHVPETS